MKAVVALILALCCAGCVDLTPVDQETEVQEIAKRDTLADQVADWIDEVDEDSVLLVKRDTSAVADDANVRVANPTAKPGATNKGLSNKKATQRRNRPAAGKRGAGRRKAGPAKRGQRRRRGGNPGGKRRGNNGGRRKGNGRRRSPGNRKQRKNRGGKRRTG